ncbi:unnamed protein product [Blepharisma stoltei]|uniref:PDZ GRASP-type domain-containing protein n=1 Tax=Blepharisma stoltei TaxID=1481888 RepID=A0AAU9J2H8_9CILI|nr:unnamed protein product [Blepharisma stoltei]
MGSSESNCGFRVIDVNPTSPAHQAGLISYLDFIVYANGIRLQQDGPLQNIISKSIRCKVFLKVFNILDQAFREIIVTPRNDWGGEGLLGATLRWEDWTEIPSLRIIEVFPNSLASELGLVENTDFILGTADETLNSLSRLEGILRHYEEATLFVYNSEIGEVRKIHVKNPEKKSLGCGVGEGVFHALDKAKIEALKKEKSEAKQEKPEEKKEDVIVTVPQQKPKDENIPPPPPPKAETHNIEKKPESSGVIKLLPPPSIYDLNDEKAGFQTNILKSKYIIQ